MLDSDFVASLRFYSLSGCAFKYWIYLVHEGLKLASGTLPLEEYADVAAALRVMNCLPAEYTDGDLLRELSGVVPHLVTITDDELILHGFDTRYSAFIARRKLTSERTRRWRERHAQQREPTPDLPVDELPGEDVLPVTPCDAPKVGDASQRHKASQGVTKRHGSVNVDVDVDVDVKRPNSKSPPLTFDGPVPSSPAPTAKGTTAGIAHIERTNSTATAPTTASRSEKAPAEQPHQPGPEVLAHIARWAKTDGYDSVANLQRVAGGFDRFDPVTLLAHCLEIEAMGSEARQRCAVLLNRISPLKAGESWILPGDAHMAEAKRRLDITPEAAVSIMASAATPGGNGHAAAVGSASALGEVLGGTATKGLQERVTRRRKGGAA